MADKSTTLSIVIATVDKATAKIKAINAELDKASKPTRDFKKALGELSEKSGLDGVMSSLKGVGSAIGDLLGKVAMIGGVAAIAVVGLLHLVDGFDDLGKKAARLGVSADFLAEMRDAAERTGVPIEALDESLLAFNQNLGAARAGTGRMAKFLGLVSPALLKQVKAAKDNAEAFDLMAGAMAKIEDPAKRAALAQKVFGDSALAPLFAKGPAALKEMREHYLALAGSQQPAVDAATDTAEAMHNLHAATDGVKASLVAGLAPALTVIIGQMTEWLSGHQADIKEWAADIGEKLPGAVHTVVDAIKDGVSWVVSFVDKIGGMKTVALALGAVLLGPLISAIASFGIALLATPIGPFLAIIAAIVAAVALAVKAIGALAAYGRREGERAAFRKLTEQHADEIKENNPDLSYDEIQSQARRMARYDIDQSHAVEDAADKQEEYNDAHAGDLPGAPASGSAMYAPPATFQAKEAFDGHTEAMANSFVKAMQEAPPVKSMLTVDFANAPKGMRVTTDPQSTGDVDLSVGYNFGFAQ